VPWIEVRKEINRREAQSIFNRNPVEQTSSDTVADLVDAQRRSINETETPYGHDSDNELSVQYDDSLTRIQKEKKQWGALFARLYSFSKMKL
jgi:hypothetical protein